VYQTDTSKYLCSSKIQDGSRLFVIILTFQTHTVKKATNVDKRSPQKKASKRKPINLAPCVMLMSILVFKFGGENGRQAGGPDWSQ
jgi:hypothetical protein